MALRYLITHLSRADSSMGERILTLCMCLRSGTWLSPARSLCKQFVQCLSVCAADTIPDRWHQSPRGIGCVLLVLAERAVYREGGRGGFGGVCHHLVLLLQFFILFKSAHHLDFKHTVFGRVVGGTSQAQGSLQLVCCLKRVSIDSASLSIGGHSLIVARLSDA